VGVAFTTAALIIVLSVFNGIDDLLRSLNNSFDPEIKIEAALGKSFHRSDSLINAIQKTPGVVVVTEVIEDYAYVRYRDANQVITLKGVSDNYIDQNRIPADNLVEGKLALKEGKIPYAIVGQGVSSTLSVDVNGRMHALQIYYIKNVKGVSSDPSKMYAQRSILPGGVFAIIPALDDNYVIVPLDFAEDLIQYGDKRTSLEIKTDGSDISVIKNRLQEKLGDKFKILDQEEQHPDLYKLLKMEKLFVFLAFTLLLGVGSINVFFSLMMLALDKKKDLSVLSAMGAPQALIHRIFLIEGALIAVSGACLGLVVGCLLSWAQQTYGFVSMGMETAVSSGYPVKVKGWDVMLTLAVTCVITILISLRPAFIAARSASVQNL